MPPARAPCTTISHKGKSHGNYHTSRGIQPFWQTVECEQDLALKKDTASLGRSVVAHDKYTINSKTNILAFLFCYIILPNGCCGRVLQNQRSCRKSLPNTFHGKTAYRPHLDTARAFPGASIDKIRLLRATCSR